MITLTTKMDELPGICRETAAWFEAGAKAADATADAVQDARITSVESWSGPAATAFADALLPHRDRADDLAVTCHFYARALNDFADAIDSAYNLMNDAMDKAAAGDLIVDGPLIEAPDASALGSPPVRPTEGNRDTLAAHFRRVDEYNARVDAYDAKRVVFNECSDIIKEARFTIDQAHVNLAGDLSAREGGTPLPDWKIGTIHVDKVLDGVYGTSTTQQKILKRINDANADVQAYEKMSNATRLAATPEEMERLRAAASKAGANQTQTLDWLQRMERGRLPERYHTTKTTPPRHARYEGPRRIFGAKRTAGMSPPEYAAKRLLPRAIPFIGDGITLFDEFGDAARGRQTLAAAAVKSIGVIGAGYAGGAIGGLAGGAIGAAIGSPTGPGLLATGGIGAVIGSVVGDPLASIGAVIATDHLANEYMSDQIYPDHQEVRLDKIERAQR